MGSDLLTCTAIIPCIICGQLHYLWTVILTIKGIHVHYLWTVILTIKGIHVDQAVFDRLTKGQLTIITHRNSYAVISVPLADKIRARDELHFIVIADQTNGQLNFKGQSS